MLWNVAHFKGFNILTIAFLVQHTTQGENLDKVEARYTKAKAILDKMSQNILAKAFLGELVPQNPEDEPASVLLEIIKKEKIKTYKKKQTPRVKQIR